MKRILLIFAVLFSVMTANAQTETEAKAIDLLVAGMNLHSDEVVEQTNGMISDMKVTRQGKDVVMDMYFNIPGFDISLLSSSDKEMLNNMFGVEMAKNFMTMSASDPSSRLALQLLKSLGSHIICNIYDSNGNKLSTDVDLSKLEF